MTNRKFRWNLRLYLHCRSWWPILICHSSYYSQQSPVRVVQYAELSYTWVCYFKPTSTTSERYSMNGLAGGPLEMWTSWTGSGYLSQQTLKLKLFQFVSKDKWCLWTSSPFPLICWTKVTPGGGMVSVCEPKNNEVGCNACLKNELFKWWLLGKYGETNGTGVCFRYIKVLNCIFPD